MEGKREGWEGEVQGRWVHPRSSLQEHKRSRDEQTETAQGPFHSTIVITCREALLSSFGQMVTSAVTLCPKSKIRSAGEAAGFGVTTFHRYKSTLHFCLRYCESHRTCTSVTISNKTTPPWFDLCWTRLA